MAEYLEWPPERATEVGPLPCGWSQPGSNIAMDFHGNPNSAAVTVLSDGNHHMALQESLSGFVRQQAEVDDVFYVTLPPQLINIAKQKGLQSDRLKKWIDKGTNKIMFGKSVHHREAPQALFENKCDVAILYYHLALRFTKIFPDLFELIPLGGSVDNPQPGSTNVVSAVHMGLFIGSSALGKVLYGYLQSQPVKEVYAKHGLQEI